MPVEAVGADGGRAGRAPVGVVLAGEGQVVGGDERHERDAEDDLHREHDSEQLHRRHCRGRLTFVAQPGHKDRLSAVDASFLAQEKQSSHMHVGALVIFDGPAPSRDEFRAHLAARLPRVPRYRQKLAFPPLEAGRPFWVDDPNFNLDYHVRHTALPKPGSEDQLRELAGRIFSQRLDRSKPLWEVWIVHGLEGGRFSLISKTHHALVDGVSGVDIATVLFDLSPVPDELEPRGASGRRHPSRPTSSWWPRASWASHARRSASRAARWARSSARARRSSARARPPRGSARSSGRE